MFGGQRKVSGKKRLSKSRRVSTPKQITRLKKSARRPKSKSIKRRRSKNGRRTGPLTKSGYKMKSKSKIRIPVKRPGALEGYHVDDPLKVKRKMLEWYIDKDGYSTVIKRLNVLAIYNKNRNEKMSNKIKRDIKFLQKKYPIVDRQRR